MESERSTGLLAIRRSRTVDGVKLDSQVVLSLKVALERYALRQGTVRLSSGRESKYYYNGKPVFQHPRFRPIVGALIADEVIRAGAEAVGGLEVGAVPLAQAVSDAAFEKGVTIPAFFVRKERKSHGPSYDDKVAVLNADAGFADDGRPLLSKGRRVAIVDDVVTGGGSALLAVEAVTDVGCDIVLVMPIVERHEQGGDVFRSKGIPFKCLFHTDENGVLTLDHELEARLGLAAATR
jgi:orotate phosphoribosyltransferase